MAFELRALRRQKIQYDSDNVENQLVVQLILDGEKVTPTCARITIYRKGSSTALVDDELMSISGTLATYTVDTTTESSWPIETGYRAEVTFTYSSETYKRVYVFDVVRFLLNLNIGVDQLVSIDDRVDGMEHASDDTLAPLIVACRDVIQVRVENKAIKDKKLVENMILDYSALATCARFYMLAQLFFTKRDMETYEKYNTDFEQLLDQTLSMTRYDEGQDGDEDSEVGGLQEVRLET